MHRHPEPNTRESPHDDRMPLTRRVLYACFALLALWALFRFDLLLLVPATLVIGVHFKLPGRITQFGYKRRKVPAAQPRDTRDPVVRACLVVGCVMFLAGLAAFLPFFLTAAGNLQWWMLFSWLAPPGLHAILLGAVLTALGFDLLQGGLGRSQPEPLIVAGEAPIMPKGPGLARYIAPWLALAALADLYGWPPLAQAIVTLIGLGILRHLATSWPLFAALSAPAVAFYGWSASGHATHTAGPTDMLEFLIFVVAMGVGISLVLWTLGRATTGLLDTLVRRTRAPAPWLRQAVLGVAACLLAESAHTHLMARAERREAAGVAAGEKQEKQPTDHEYRSAE
ncbi:hypothetical protein [Methyloversatilis sp. XJ19-49]|uniref:hypothetical protein n=1 Tax=Methyloversatilis sp. XJ19-49 TaxID=2963429 RepID=UPI00211C6E01|nr:hypothetical protein [Methyloversatilis sp. XJ19-49]MCQ9379062.1 hypothetical protein [Methyloversatilis sp. XJ19-49]